MSILLPLNPLPDLAEPLWLPGPENPGLPGDELHIWRAHLNDPRLCEGDEWRDCPVSRDRSEKLQAALFRNDVIERYTGAPFTPVVGLRIVVAQCDHLALIAVSRDIRRMGLDLERVLEDIPVEEIAGGFLDARAQWDLRVTWSQQEKAWKFFQFWTSNEACEQALPSSRAALSCKVRGFSPDADFIAALAVEGGPEAGVLYWDWTSHGL